MNPRKLNRSLSQRLIFRIILFVSIVALAVAVVMNYYILVYNRDNLATTAIPTTYPTPTPTPSYLPYINRPATYVGIIETFSLNEIVLLREDNSRVVLTIKGNIPVYNIENTPGGIPTIVTQNISSLAIGDTLSVYAEDRSITALFLSGH